MSHVVKIDVEIKNIKALKKACENLGLQFNEGQKEYKWYGRHVGDYCFDSKTSVMTQTGLKLFQNLTPDDLIMTLNPTTKKIEYQPAVIVINDYNGDMYDFNGRIFSQVVTPNHRMYVRRKEYRKNRRQQTYKFVEAEVLANKLVTRYTIFRGGDWAANSPEYIEIPPSEREAAICYSAGDWMEFMGWFIAEGNISKAHNYRTYIWQSKEAHPKNFERIRRLLDRLGLHHNVVKHNTGVVITSKRLYSYLDALGLHVGANHKFIPQYFKDVAPHLLQRLIESLVMGDGSDGRRFYTSSHKLRDDFVEIAVKCGFGCCFNLRESNPGWHSKPIWDVCFSRTMIHHRITNVNKIFYSGKTYCVSTINGIVMVERNGKLSWSGNSLPEGFEAKDLGKCDHAISVPGKKDAYEVGVCKRRDGKEGHTLLFDFWSGGYGLEAKVGKDCSKLTHEYTKEVAKGQLESLTKYQGWTMNESTNEAGETVLTLRKY